MVPRDLPTRRARLRFMDTAIEMLHGRGVRFIVPSWWRYDTGRRYRGIPVVFSDRPPATLQEWAGVTRWMRERVDVAIRRLERRRLAPYAIIVPPSWCRELGANYQGLPVAPTVGAGDWDKGNPPRVEAAPQHGPNAYEPITGGFMSDDSNTRPGLPANVVDAIKQLVNAELDSDLPSRFHRASRVCDIAQQLAEMYFHRVGDDEAALNVMGDGVPADYPGRPLRRGEIARNPYGRLINEAPAVPRLDALPPNERDFARDVLSTEHALARALQLNNALQLRANADTLGLEPELLDQMIRDGARAMLAQQETRNALDDSQLLRRHQGGVDQPDNVQGARGAGNGTGTASAQDAPQRGAQEEVAPRELDGLRRGDGAPGPHREGLEAHREGAQAGEAARVGGEVRERQDGGGDRVQPQGNGLDSGEFRVYANAGEG